MVSYPLTTNHCFNFLNNLLHFRKTLKMVKSLVLPSLCSTRARWWSRCIQVRQWANYEAQTMEWLWLWPKSVTPIFLKEHLNMSWGSMNLFKCCFEAQTFLRCSYFISIPFFELRLGVLNFFPFSASDVLSHVLIFAKKFMLPI